MMASAWRTHQVSPDDCYDPVNAVLFQRVLGPAGGEYGRPVVNVAVSCAKRDQFHSVEQQQRHSFFGSAPEYSQ